MISGDSRYTRTVLQVTATPDGPKKEMRIPFPAARQVSFTYYRVRQGDRIDHLADYFFGNSQLWWLIADVNPEILNWMDLPMGVVIRIPNG